MIKLTEVPIVFVHYPKGAGGWFLASLLQHSFDRTEHIEINNVGSGHLNTRIGQINSFYSNFIETKKGLEILLSINFQDFPYADRIDYLRENLFANKKITQTISIHATDIDIFLEAFPNSKCIQIIVEDQDLIKCAINLLYKNVRTQPIGKIAAFTNLSKEMNRTDKEIEEDILFLDRIDEGWLTRFDWVIPFINQYNQVVSTNEKFDDRVLEITFNEYMTDPIDNVLPALLNFAHSDNNYYTRIEVEDKEMSNNLYKWMISYRLQQLDFLFKDMIAK